ncbi:MAG TPA: hypothetical protein VFZ17_04435 [Acidimicrobiia bacterium]|nr:hypothetical protein [Acidimicrobiia bacterium]
MTSVLIAGLGDVGVRTARQLLDTPGIDHVYVAARSQKHADTVASALHDGATPWELSHHDPVFPDGVDAIASALPPHDDLTLAQAALRAGISFASASDDANELNALVGLDADARAAGLRVLVGCGLAPGLSDVLARHAAGALDAVDEIHVARWGVAGETCAESARRAHRDPGLEWRDGAYVHDRHQGPELVWFPDPVGARECALVASGVELLVTANPGLERATVRLGGPAPRVGVRRALTPPPRRDPGASWGAVRAEAWGQRGDTRETVVYGVIEQTAVATGTVLGVAAAALAGGMPDVTTPTLGAHGLGTAVNALPFLAELARRGVKAAAFEGATIA